MTFPPGLDPLAVTEVIFNVCYFNNLEENDDYEVAEAKLRELFPNAEISGALHHEDRSFCICKIQPEEALSFEEWRKLNAALEDILPQGPYRGKPEVFDCNFRG